MDIIKRLQEFNLDADTQRLLDYYDSPSYMEMMGVSRSETAHSAFLAYLLNPEQSHQLGKKFFTFFLELVLGTASGNNGLGIIEFDFEALHQELLVRNLQINNITTFTEFSIENGRIDILLHFDIKLNDEVEKYVMVVENKVGHSEGKTDNMAQTDYYHQKISNKFPDYKRIYVYLTPPGAPNCSNKTFVHVTYQDVLDKCIQPCIELDNITTQTKFILTDYVKSLSKPAIFKDNKDKKSKYKIIMGIGNQEKTLLKKFWEKYKDLIQSAATAVATDESSDIDEEEKEAAKQVAENISRSSKRYRFQIGNDDIERNMTQTVIELVTKYLKLNGANITFDDLQNTFSPIPKRSNMIFKNKHDVIGGDAEKIGFRNPLKSGESVIYVAKNIWNRKPEFEGLIKISKSLGPEFLIKDVSV